MTILAISTLPMQFRARAETSIPSIEDPSPDYYETSEYMIGRVAVGVIFMESNGTKDPNTENWTSSEESSVTSKIQAGLDWWSRQNPGANVSFIFDFHYRVPTSYEPINRQIIDLSLWQSEAMKYLGYSNTFYLWQDYDYDNALRYNLGTDWAFVMFIVRAVNDNDGYFADKSPGNAALGGPSLVLPIKTTDNFDWIVAHEMAHMFRATDEYDDLKQYNGYLNVSDISNSGGIMDKFGSWSISGKPQGLQGTWGQIGWRDSDGDGIQDIVDTIPRVFVNPYETIGSQLNFTGVTAVTPYPNIGKRGWAPRNVTINKIESVEFSVDGGQWLNATVTPTKVQKLIKYPDTNITKDSYAVVNYTFSTSELSPGNHTIEVKSTDNWSNSGFANQTVTIPEIVHDVAITRIKPYRTILGKNTTTSMNVTVENKGNVTETFNVSLYYNTSQVGTQTITLPSRQSTILKFNWTTPSILENYTIKAEAQVLGDINVTDNILIFGSITVSIPGDINADGKVNILDISLAAKAYSSKLGEDRWEANADVNEDGIINILDISAIAKEYGKSV